MTAITPHRRPGFLMLCNPAFALRREVFLVAEKVPEGEEQQSYDLTATHFVAIADGEVVGTLRVLFLAEHAKIGRVAVKASWRGHGIAKKLMLAAMVHARASGQERFYLTAQTDKIGLYEKLGFT